MIKVIPEYVARVPVWVEGMFAGRCVYDRNRSQQFAAVRNGSCEGRMAVHMVSSATGVTFGGFQRRVASFRVAGVALRDIQTCFVTCRKWFCVAGTILLRRFQKMHCRSLQFSWQAQHFNDLHRHFA